MKGKFIVIEGLDGAGKSTAIRFIKKYLKSHKLSGVYTREPGGTPIAEDLRDILLNNVYDRRIHPYTELLIIYAGRVEHYNNVIKPSLEKSINVISDRFNWSTMAYQGGGRGVSLDKIKMLNSSFIEGVEPDLTIYLDLDPLLCFQRLKKQGGLDRIEQSGLDFFNKARRTFKYLVQTSDKAVEVDSSQSFKAIENELCQILDNYFSF